LTTSLDTDVCIEIIRGRNPIVRDRLLQSGAGNVVISSVAYFELVTGAEKSRDRQRASAALRLFLERIALVDFSNDDAEAAARLRTGLESRGQGIGPYDTLIAGQALARGFVVATNNVRAFSRVSGLAVENWLAPL